MKRRSLKCLLLSLVLLAPAACGPVNPEDNSNNLWNQNNQNQLWQDAGTNQNHSGDATVDNCLEQARYIYVVDSENGFHRFDPQVMSPAAFTKVGDLTCSGTATPNSMAISRDGFAYVLYGGTDWLGEYECDDVYQVNIVTGQCLGGTPFTCGAQGFTKFGMGYATDTANTDNDRLYIGSSIGTDLGTLDTASGAVTRIGTLPIEGGEFTGNASGELWGFFPYANPPTVHQIDKANGAILRSFPLGTLPSIGMATSAAWAFAFWGGSFYLFYMLSPPDESTRVYRIDAEGVLTTHIDVTGLRIVGAGVSTCAPIIVR
jgi:hypothetical protein